MSHTLKGSIISAAAAVALLASGATAFAATTISVPAECSDNAGTPVLTVTQQITEADTGAHGTWATDAFTETAQIYTANAAATAYSYCAVGTIDTGSSHTFTTTGPNSPANGDSLKAGITGAITGGETWLIPAGESIDAGITGSTYTATPVNAPTQDSKFSDWQNQVFGSTTGANTFSFNYVTDADSNITWLNDGAGNSGDITNPTMTTIYVDGNTGDDTNNIGTQAYPYKTIQAAVNALPSGGTINVAAGTYAGDVTVNASNLTINGAGVGSSIINLGSGYGISLDNGGATNQTNFSMSGFTVNSSSGTTYAFKGYKADGLKLSNMDFEGNSYGGGVDLNTTSNVTITNVKASGFHKNGFAVTSAYTAADSSTPSTGLTFNGITSSNNGWTGMAFYTTGNSGGSANIGTVTFSGSNTISGNGTGGATQGGIFIEGDTDANVGAGATPVNTVTSDGTTLNLSTIAFSGNSAFDILNYQTAAVNAFNATFSGKTGNAMSSSEQTSEDAMIYDHADNAALGTVNYNSQDVFVNSDGTVSTDVHSDQSLSGTSTDGGTVTVTANILAGTTVTSDSSWDGSISAPTATTTTVTIPGITATVKAAVEIGSSGHDLTFDKAVQLVFSGLAHMNAGWYNAAGQFTAISTVCTDNTQAGNDTNLASGDSCYIDSGNDLVVWTKHFSTFVVYDAAVNGSTSSSGGSSAGGNGPISGGGGGGGAVVVLPNNGGSAPTGSTNTGSTGTTNTGSTGGQVLGAAAYNFATNLTVGSRGQDVVELQNVLIAEGDLAAGLNTGYFGSLTKAAVIKYQTAHGISPTSGFVGPLTRAELNKGTTPTMSDEQKSVLLAQLLQEVQALQAQLAALQGSSSTSLTGTVH